MADDEAKPKAAGNEAGARRPPGWATPRFAGYRLDELTEALAFYQDALADYRDALADALAVWLAGEHLEADKQATHRLEAARQAVAAAIILGRRLGVTLGNRPLIDLI